MHLLKHKSDVDFELVTFSADNLPPYAILSHTWVDGEELTYEELVAGTGKDKAGYTKICFCGEKAAQDDLQYFWVDTCCIDKRNNNELTKAINSMFRWYHNAAKCYVYLSDVSTPRNPDVQSQCSTWETAFQKSRWFTRGWTLQELIAPKAVEFFSSHSELLGNKESLEQQIHAITKIPIEALQGQSLDDFSVEERISWAAGRRTKEEEDEAYCLLGIFGVSMPLVYGEGNTKAFRRLLQEVAEKSASKKVSIEEAMAQAHEFLHSCREGSGTSEELQGIRAEVTHLDSSVITLVGGLLSVVLLVLPFLSAILLGTIGISSILTILGRTVPTKATILDKAEEVRELELKTIELERSTMRILQVQRYRAFQASSGLKSALNPVHPQAAHRTDSSQLALAHSVQQDVNREADRIIQEIYNSRQATNKAQQRLELIEEGKKVAEGKNDEELLVWIAQIAREKARPESSQETPDIICPPCVIL